MAVTLRSPIFSFFQFSETEEACTWIERQCLPVYDLSDLAFQVLAEVDGADKPLFDGYHIGAGVTVDCGDPGILEENFTGTWHKYETGDGDNPDKWVGYFAFNENGLFELYDYGQCFNLMLYRTDSGLPIQCFITCLVKIFDPCYTSILAYRNDTDAFGFNYTVPTYNRVRLYFYPHSPTNSEESKNYAKSDGSSALISYRMWKDYKVKTDYMMQANIERFTVATAHDDLRITSTYAGLNQAAVVRPEKVEVAWKEDETPQFNMAQASTVLRLAAPRENANTNCG